VDVIGIAFVDARWCSCDRFVNVQIVQRATGKLLTALTRC